MEADCAYELVAGNETVTSFDASLEENPCYGLTKFETEVRAPYNRDKSKSKKHTYSWLCMCALVGFILVGSAAFASLALTVWNISQVNHELKVALIQLQISVNDNISKLERNVQSSTNNFTAELEKRTIQLQNYVNDGDELQGNISRSLDSEISNIIQSLSGLYSSLPATSCSQVLLSNPSGYYWIRSSNGSSVRVYCDFNRQCGCDGPSMWTRVAFLNMSDPNQVCPRNWTTISTPVRTCGRGRNSSRGCSSVFYPTFGLTYSHVCGHITAYQDGAPDAFDRLVFYDYQINAPYIDGISLTHGTRQHIWSFVGSAGEMGNFMTNWVCACSNNNTWPHDTAFVGNDYFCDSGNHGTFATSNAFYPDDPLWDGQGCGPSSTCCQFNNPPWFCKILTQSTTDDLEVRICHSGGVEDTPVQLIELYVQ